MRGSNLARLRSAALLLLLAGPACSKSPPDVADAAPPVTCSGDVLFGRPVPSTGLSDAQCQPRCTCGGKSWQAPDYTAANADALLGWQLLQPPAQLTADPYAGPAPAPSDAPDEVCAVVPTPPGSHTYRLETFTSEDAATKQSAIPTHFGACGLCSPLVDLAVYMRYPDLTAPVRDCAIQNLGGTEANQIKCLRDLGFDPPCAQIWYFNTVHTSDACAVTCFGVPQAPYNEPDGGLNACLQCDEDKSGAVFKAVAGRTRRNTGIASAMCRPCSEVRPLVHAYP